MKKSIPVIVLLVAGIVFAAPNVVTLIKGSSYMDPQSKARIDVSIISKKSIEVSVMPFQKKKKSTMAVRNECLAWQTDGKWRHVIIMDYTGNRTTVLFMDGRGESCHELW